MVCCEPTNLIIERFVMKLRFLRQRLTILFAASIMLSLVAARVQSAQQPEMARFGNESITLTVSKAGDAAGGSVSGSIPIGDKLKLTATVSGIDADESAFMHLRRMRLFRMRKMQIQSQYILIRRNILPRSE